MIDLKINPQARKKAVERAREKGILIPTLKQMVDPSLISDSVKTKLSEVGLWDINPLNLFRISWKNEPVEKGGAFGDVNYMEIPSEISGVKARILCLVGKYFPTGAHKVGATFGCLVPKLVTGQFDPTSQSAVWPSTGNYCRGGAYNSRLLACKSIAILPEEMSQERFEWLKGVADEVIATPGCESNVKEIFDKCWELKNTRDDVVIFNQFDEFGNHLWHYYVTGNSIQEMLNLEVKPGQKFSAYVSATGSAGTIAAGDFLKERYSNLKIVASEALQCPTLLNNGFGGHRIEGIGDKHVPWIHNVKNTDVVAAVDDDYCMNLLRLFNEDEGKRYLGDMGVDSKVIEKLELVGISGIGNLIAAIKHAKYHEMDENDVIVTILTDSKSMYDTRLVEMNDELGNYKREDAVKDYHKYLMGVEIDNLLELGYRERKRIHNLKYYTWIEQQQKDLKELDAQWYDSGYWEQIHGQVEEIDTLIEQFNADSGVKI